MNKKMNEFEGLEKKVVAQEISISIMDSRTYRGVTYWCSPDGLCELPMDCGTACGSEDLLRDMIDVDMEVP